VLLAVPGVGPGQNADILVRMVRDLGISSGYGAAYGPFTVTLGGGTVPIQTLPLGIQPLTLCFDCRCDAVVLEVHQIADQILIWHSRGSLQSADSPNGPWNELKGWPNPYFGPMGKATAKQFFRAKANFAPDSIAGSALGMSITAGTLPLVSTGQYQIAFGVFSPDRFVVNLSTPNIEYSTGTYTYASTSDTTATFSIDDKAAGSSATELKFTSPKGGTFRTVAGGVAQTGDFTLFQSACF